MNLSVGIGATREVVFAVVADVEHAPDRIDGYERVEMLADGPVPVGTKWRETRRMNDKRSIEEWEMTACERPSYFSAYCDSQGCDVHWTIRVDPEGGVDDAAGKKPHRHAEDHARPRCPGSGEMGEPAVV